MRVTLLVIGVRGVIRDSDTDAEPDRPTGTMDGLDWRARKVYLLDAEAVGLLATPIPIPMSLPTPIGYTEEHLTSPITPAESPKAQRPRGLPPGPL